MSCVRQRRRCLAPTWERFYMRPTAQQVNQNVSIIDPWNEKSGSRSETMVNFI
jgi:hypothetical protein